MPESAASPTNAFRQNILHNYHDHAQVVKPDPDTDQQCGDERSDERKGSRGGVKVPFPTKLHLMLSKVEESGLRLIVSWWDPLHFVWILLLRYATQTNKHCLLHPCQATSRTMLCGAQAEGICGGCHADLLPPIEAHFIPASVESIRFRPHY